MKTLFALVIPLMLLLGCAKSATKRVIVDYPERWSEGEFRNCALVGTDPVSNLPQLDCDLQASETPRRRMFTMDVTFDGPREKRLNINWTCQRTKLSADTL